MCLSPPNFQPASLPVIDKFNRHCQCKKFIFPKFIGHYILWYSFNIGLLILRYKGLYSQTELSDGSWQLNFPLSYLEPYIEDWLFIDLKLRGSLSSYMYSSLLIVTTKSSYQFHNLSSPWWQKSQPSKCQAGQLCILLITSWIITGSNHLKINI